jgi:hypothetical protein
MRKYVLIKEALFWTLWISVMAVFIYVIWHIVYPKPPLILYSIVVTNPGRVVMAGTNMTYDVDYEKKLPGTCRVKRQLVNSSLVDYDVIDPPEKALGRQIAHSSIHVPLRADPGEWYMRWTADCPTGILSQTVSVTGRSDTFTVVQPPEKRGERGKQGPAGKNFWGK